MTQLRRGLAWGGPLWLEHLLALLGIFLLWLAFFWQPIFLPEVHVPRGGGDLASFLYPVYSFAASQLRQGVFPLWNPYLYSGAPFAADIQTGLYYPINWLAYLFARPFTYETMEWLSMGHYFLAAGFTYALARGLGLNWAGAFAGAIIFGFSGPLISRLGNLNTLAASSWLPLLLFLLWQSLKHRSLRWALVGGLAFSLDIFAGHTQMSLYLGFALGLFWLWALLGARLGPREPAHQASRQARDNAWQELSWRSVVSYPLLVGVALLGAAVQLLPSLELIRLSVRSDLSYQKALEFAASPMGLLNLVVPHFFGDNAADYWGITGSLTEDYGYVGISTLVLALVGVLLRHKERFWLWFFLALALLSVLLALGQSTPLYGWLYRFVPGFDKVRAPGRFLMPLGLSLAMLAAFGIDVLSRPLARRSRPHFGLALKSAAGVLGLGVFVAAPFFYYALLTSQDKDPVIFNRVRLAIDSLNLSLFYLAVTLLLLVVYRYRRQGFRLMPGLALALVTIDLFGANMRFNPAAEPQPVGFDHPQVIAFLRQHNEPFRIDSFTGVWDVWQPNTTLLERVDDALGIFNPLQLARYDRYWGNLGSRSVPGYDLLNARYVIGHKDVQLDWSKFTPVLTDAPKVNVYENRRVLPRAMVAPRAQVMNTEALLARLRAEDFDPQKELLLERAPAEGITPGRALPAYRIESIKHPTVNEVVVRGNSSAPGYLLLGEVYYPGWQATVNGRPTEVLQADYVFRSVAVPAGDFEVRFSFVPRLWQLGLAISALTWLASLALLTVGAVRRT